MKQRKNLRLKGYDYSNSGLYFVTICTFEKKYSLSYITDRRDSPCGCPQVILTRLGKICKANLFNIEKLFNIKVVNYIIMPNHIHLIIEVKEHNARTGASPVPTVAYIACQYTHPITFDFGKRIQSVLPFGIFVSQNSVASLTVFCRIFHLSKALLFQFSHA